MTDWTFDKIQAFITGAGFSVFVALWYMIRHDKSLEALTKAINELRDAVMKIGK